MHVCITSGHQHILAGYSPAIISNLSHLSEDLKLAERIKVGINLFSLDPEFRKLKSTNLLKRKAALHPAVHIRKPVFTHLGAGDFFNMSAIIWASIGF
ncbi:MAG TPA: hypothetical protein VKA92_09885 [Segetibacter sp.]|nr:hypothetical protein [Segetibacter sp.]